MGTARNTYDGSDKRERMNHRDAGRTRSNDGWSRRHYIVATVGVAALSGCTTESGDGTETAEPDDGEELPAGVSAEEFERGPVPDEYRSATSLGGEARDPDELQTKANVRFSEYDEALENDAHRPGTCCGNCADYIPDRNGDGFGACAEVEGYIDRADWCTIFEELPEPAVPDGMTEADLATAEVPEAYRTASSQGGEARTPDDLETQDDVGLRESVGAIADGPASPGQSCGTCAEFIPDENGDGWGACAAVEGYIAVEDWCAIWEPVTAEL
jgi:hypothetical protein